VWTDRELQEQFFTQIVGPVFDTGGRHLRTLVAQGRVRPCQVGIVIPTIVGSLIILSMLRALAPAYLLADFSEEELVDELTHLYLHGLAPGLEATVA
jgi:hypothetical protein